MVMERDMTWGEHTMQYTDDGCIIDLYTLNYIILSISVTPINSILKKEEEHKAKTPLLHLQNQKSSKQSPVKLWILQLH